MTRRRLAAMCSPGTAERIVQGAVAVLIGAFALDSLDNPTLAIIAGLVAVVLLAGTIGGWCPGALLARRAAAAEPNTRGIPEARQPLEP